MNLKPAFTVKTIAIRCFDPQFPDDHTVLAQGFLMDSKVNNFHFRWGIVAMGICFLSVDVEVNLPNTVVFKFEDRLTPLIY